MNFYRNNKQKKFFPSPNIKPFIDLINKNKEFEKLYINTVKSIYFDRKDEVDENIKFTTIKD